MKKLMKAIYKKPVERKALLKALDNLSVKKDSAEDLIKQEQYRRDKAQMMTGKMSKEAFKKKWSAYKAGK